MKEREREREEEARIPNEREGQKQGAYKQTRNTFLLCRLKCQLKQTEFNAILIRIACSIHRLHASHRGIGAW